MAFPTIANSRIDKRLTNVSLEYTNNNFINELVLPKIPNLTADTGYISSYSRDNMRVYDSVMAKRQVSDLSPHRVEYKLGTDKSYAIDYYDHEIVVTDRSKDQTELPFNRMNDARRQLENIRMEIMESALGTVLADATVLTNTSTPSVLWDVSTSTPIDNMLTVQGTIEDAIGRLPNRVVTNTSVIRALQKHPEFINRVVNSGTSKTVGKMQVISIIEEELGVKVLVGSTKKVTSKEGQAVTTGGAWSDDFLMYYTPDAPSKHTPSFGYRFDISGGNKQVTTRRDSNDIGDVVKIWWAYQDKILDISSSYLLDQVIS